MVSLTRDWPSEYDNQELLKNQEVPNIVNKPSVGDIPPDDGKGIRATELLSVIRCDCVIVERKQPVGLQKNKSGWVAQLIFCEGNASNTNAKHHAPTFRCWQRDYQLGQYRSSHALSPIVEWTVVCQLATKANKEENRPSRSAPASIKICKRQLRWNGDV